MKFVLAITLKMSVSDPMLVKPKCVWELSVFFNFQKFVYIFQLFVYNFSNKIDGSQTHFGFSNIGSEMLIFRVIAKTNFKFWFGSPPVYLFSRYFKKGAKRDKLCFIYIKVIVIYRVGNTGKWVFVVVPFCKIGFWITSYSEACHK